MKNVHAHALWIYGVIVGLAIREALTQTLTHVFPENPPLQPVHFGHLQLILESLRVVVFLITIIRFYFGAAFFFDSMYGADADTGNRVFGFDFLSGAAHFLLFFAWSYSITFHERVGNGVSWFMLLMFTVLVYDLFWYLASLPFDTADFIGFWTILNLITVAISLGLFTLVTLRFSREIAEIMCFVPVIIVAIIDLGDTASGKNLITRWFSDLVGHREPEREQFSFTD
jgi:hypothetical protein